MMKVTKRNNIYGALAFVCSIISAGIYCYGVQQLAVKYEYQNAWTKLFALLPIAALMITSLFTGEIKNSRKIPIIITAPLLIIGFVDSVSNEATFLPKTTLNLFDVITGDELLSKCSIIVFTYVVFALMVFFIPLCKPIWTKAFCLLEAGLYLFSIIYFAVDDYYDLDIVGWTTAIAYILFYIGFFFISCTMSKDVSKDCEEDLKTIAVDISSKSEFPINMLSNFASNSFTLDGVNIASMEGFLQSLKYKDTDVQRRICALTGKEAKKAGKYHNFWRITQSLYWNGKKINRYSKKYTQLITRAYDAMAQSNPEFVKALLSTGYKVLVHSVGKEYKWQTVLTEDEFTEEQLARLRIKYREAKDGE